MTRSSRLLVMLFLMILFAACSSDDAPDATADPAALDRIAEDYVRLVLAVGQHDDGYVDAYYGPPAWRNEAEGSPKSLEEIAAAIKPLLEELRAMTLSDDDEIVQLRHQYLARQLEAVAARVAMLRGETFSFDEESRALYDAEAPHHVEADFQKILDELDQKLPGQGPLIERYERFKQDFIIPPERLDTVFTVAIEEARHRTRKHLDLPEDENFVVEYVTDKSWSGYNWYQGAAQSLIQVNTDLPIYIDRAVDLAAHEGYPGHHVYNALLEKNLVRDRGWVEFSVYPLFSPQSLIAEGSANYGIDMVFPEAERLAFEREVLFPLAGLDPERVEEYYEIEEMVSRLSYAGNEAARKYLDGEIDAEAAADYLSTYALMPRERAEQRVRFIDTYRSYVINYNYGQDLVRDYVEREADGDRWEVFGALLASPRLPSGLAEQD